MTNMTVAETWAVGDIVIGGAEWGCDMRDGLGPDSHLEYGFHRIIDEIKIKTETRVDIYTSPAK